MRLYLIGTLTRRNIWTGLVLFVWFSFRLCGMESLLSDWVMSGHIRRTHQLSVRREKQKNDDHKLPSLRNRKYDPAFLISATSSNCLDNPGMYLQCGQCQASFRSRHALYLHVRFTHHKVKTVLCFICGKAFYQDYELVAHAWGVHQVVICWNFLSFSVNLFIC